MAFMDQFSRQQMRNPSRSNPYPSQTTPQLQPQAAQALRMCQDALRAASGDVGAAVSSLAASNPAFAEVLRRNKGKTASEAFLAETGIDPGWALSHIHM